jgi:hypothetical protein
MPLSEIITKSLKYPWKNRALWVLGILFSLFSSFGNVTNNIDETDFQKISGTLSPNTLIILGVFAVALAIIGAVLSIWFQIGLTQGAVAADVKKKVLLKEILKAKKGTFWNMFALQVFVPLGMMIVMVLLFAGGFVLFAAIPKPIGPIAGIITAVLVVLALIPFLVYLGLIWNLAARFVVVESKKAIESLKDSRALLKGNGWVTLGFSIILGLITGSASFFAMLPLMIAAMITVFLITQKIIIGAIISGVIALLFLGFFLVVAGYFQASAQIGHTLWWKELNKIKK